jgi:PII-like signaling protein
MGLGAGGLLQPSAWALADHVPVIVEIIDSADRILAFMQGAFASLMVHGTATLERAHVMMYRPRTQSDAVRLSLGQLLTPLSTIPKLQERPTMRTNENGVLLRVFIGESDRFDGKPLHEAIIERVRGLGLAGATVLRGSEGFGANSVVHKARLLEMSTDLPIVIEIVDTEEKIKLLLPHLETMVQEGMITMEYVVVVLYRQNNADAHR